MSESIAQVDVRALNTAEAGVIMALVTSGSNLTEKAMTGSFDVVKTVRGELFRASGTGIDWLEALHHSAFKIVRSVVQRLDGMSQEALEGAESVTMAVVGTIRGSSEAIGDVASRTVESLAGKRAAPKAA